MSQPEEEPTLTINMGGESVESHRWNTTHYTFLGELACFSHVFIITNNTPEREEGWYVFKDAPIYDELVDLIQLGDFPQHKNMLDVSQMDREAWESHYLRDFEDTFPVDWTPDVTT